MSKRVLLGCLPYLVTGQVWAQTPEPSFISQSPDWTASARADFYTRDQGSRIIPLAWARALKQPNGEPFLADSLARYGYLPNPANSEGLPVGFMTSGITGSRTLAMNCSACHTRQITVEGRTYRIDGGPAFADFQSFLTDLDTAVGKVVNDAAVFDTFAAAVLRSTSPDPRDIADLKTEVASWYERYHTLVSRALPKSPAKPWGPARLDAVGMIFNRLTGLDLGPAPNRLIPENVKVADAPTRYPFLWNAAVQDRTQWPGFAENGDDVLALARNLGQVLGVFGVFEPRRDGLLFSFLSNNSANFDGLGKLEELVKKIPPPKWPWSVDVTLAAKGKDIFDRPTANGGCNDCHGIKPGTGRLFNPNTWSTPIQNVGTDTREYGVLAWTAKTGALRGAFIPLVTSPLRETDTAFNVLRVSVLGSIVEHTVTGGFLTSSSADAPRSEIRGQFSEHINAPASPTTGRELRLPPQLRELPDVYSVPKTVPEELRGMESTRAAAATPPKGAYESRVMQGIWAAAPYLHNGSVPTLSDLLKPTDERPREFKIGPAYDRDKVGLAVEQPRSNFTLETTDCTDLNSGNSRCGHEFGTQLSPDEKRALLEYLKTL
jgi:hypothetical protein